MDVDVWNKLHTYIGYVAYTVSKMELYGTFKQREPI